MSAELEKEETEIQDSTDAASATPAPTFSRKQLRRYQTGYFLSTFAIGPPFASFVTYVGFQLQNIGYVIGHAPGEAPRSGCPPTATSCRVPFAGSGDVNLTSYILYLNAIIYAVSGALTLIVSGIGDYVDYQRGQYVVQLIVYGILCLPIASLGGSDLATFNTLSGLYVVFNIVGFIAGAWMNIFIPFVMQQSEESTSPPPSSPSDESPNTDEDAARKGIEDAVKMGVWGSNGLSAGQIVLFVISIGLTFVSTSSAGLYTTTGSGALCIAVSLLAWRLLPAPRPKHGQEEGEEGGMSAGEWLALPLRTFAPLFRQIWEHPEAFKFLLAYTVYNDTLFAFGAVTAQLFNLQVRPSLREFTYYSLAQPAASAAAATAFLYARRPARRRLGLTLRRWAALCYGLTCAAAVWCAVGIAPRSPIGFRRRWEFYAFQALQSGAAGIAGVVFRVLFSRLFPRGRAVRFFGLQLVLSLATVWVPQIVNGPVVDATDNLRLPAAVCAALLLFCVVLALLVDEDKGMRQVGYRSTGD
ncbi:putative autophagy-related protein 22 [Rosellinia necatrix]|uniref:Autophagy-related protein n=1 Tax=Rosellinia necatrix TaxID=77044 RepID=A0A1W2TRJ4_ROSNE|nr:putative autophagy-related protein 22 [Rosellinia necatrix]